MTEERTQYTTQPDELTQLRKQNRELSDKLDRQVAAWNGGTDALTAHAARQAQRIAELEQEVIGVRLSAAVMKGAYIEASAEATALEAQVQRLEQDNKRLRHLDSIPYWSVVQVANEPQLWSLPAVLEIKAWVDAQDGAA